MRKETTSSGFGRFLKKHKKYFVLPLVILVLLLALAAAVMIDRFTNRSGRADRRGTEKRSEKGFGTNDLY